MSDRTYYVICADGCKFESMTKEQILTAIQQAVSTGEINDVDAGFVTKIREKNKNAGLSFWVGTSAEYHAIISKDENCFYILTDDTIGADIVKQIEEFEKEIAELSKSYTQFKSEMEFITTSHGAMLAGLTNEITAANAKKNKILWSGTADFSSWMSGERVNNIKDYSLVIVKITITEIKYAVLCTVNETAPDNLLITGVSVVASGNESDNYSKQANIYIRLFDGCFSAQQSYIVTHNPTKTIITPTSINEIIGIM